VRGRVMGRKCRRSNSWVRRGRGKKIKQQHGGKYEKKKLQRIAFRYQPKKVSKPRRNTDHSRKIKKREEMRQEGQDWPFNKT